MYISIHNEHTPVFCNPHLMSANVIKNITANAGFAGNNKKSKAKTSFNWLQPSQEKYLSRKMSFTWVMIFPIFLH